MHDKLQTRLHEVRELILELAHKKQGVGTIEESTKWNQQSFATVRPKSGTPIRIAGNIESGTYSLFVHCGTSLISQFRDTHPDMFNYHGNREIRLELNQPLPHTALSLFIMGALTYYLKPA
ncbi:MAG TPA: DUF1801 domain-containing protein [Hellea balneolensis]|uniref:DUF1801 domain-containing protein n=1 Tax=Hellea balneolensis TaxID=287478 RepID=A0A7C5R760_9PROT|nr:DUF1801 domain-containing protein [Hellea balneolensis]